MSKMQTLDEYNKDRFAWWDRAEDERKNGSLSGVACPTCGKELRVDRSITLTSLPPQNSAWCTACGYRGYMFA